MTSGVRAVVQSALQQVGTGVIEVLNVRCEKSSD